MSSRSTRDQRQRGSVTLELVILTPALLALLFGIIQVGLIFHARNVAMTSAQEGARTAAAYEASAASGSSAAEAFAIESGAQNPMVTVNRTATLTTVTVTIDAPNLLPSVIPIGRVSQKATAPTERVTR